MNFRRSKIFSILLSLVIILAIFLTAMGIPAREAGTIELRIVHLNDVHGRLPSNEREGVLALVGLKPR